MFAFLELLFILAPAYLIRFKLGPLPLNLLEIACAGFIITFPIWLARNSQIADFIKFIRTRSRYFLILFGLFFLAAIVSTIISPSHQRAVGLFIAFFFEPMLIYFPAAYLLQDPAKKQSLIKLILILISLFSLYAIFQYFTLFHVPPQYWGNNVEPKRALSVFEYPNAYALWLAPLLAFSLAFIDDNEIGSKWLRYSALVLGVLGLLVSESRGGWVGFFVALIIFVLLSKNKKLKAGLGIGFICAIIVIICVPVFRYRVILPFKGDKSTVSRFSYSTTARKMIKDSPILGKGLYGFASNFNKYNTDPNLGAVNYPHQIFFNFWVETGLLGMVSFVLLNLWLAAVGYKKRALRYSLGLLLFIIAMWVHGLADAPYFLNDLALVFWIVAALGV